MIERELRFGADDMERFAQASGDRSPLHTDPAFARRTAFGGCIVYGGLETLGMLGLLPAGEQALVRSVRSLFPAPLLPDAVATAAAQARPDRPGEWDVRLSGRGRLLARLQTSPERPAALAHAEALAAGAPAEFATGYRPQRGPLEELAQRFGCQHIEPAVLEGVAWASNVVGATIPGFDGLCAAVTIASAAGGDPQGQRIAIRERDERTDRLLIDGVLADAAGTPRALGAIECFPFSPTPLPDSAALPHGDPLPPVRGSVVVVGASRGLGAALALELLGRGHVVHAVHHRSSDAAAALLRLAGPYAPRLLVHAVDAGDADAMAAVARSIDGPLEGIALCAATPPLAMGLTAGSAAGIAEYVAQTTALAAVPLACFQPFLRSERAWVLLASSPAVAEPSRELPQLGAAKAAVEALARWAAATSPALRVLVARPPRMRTDLANTPSARRAASPPEAIAAALVQQLLDEDAAPGLSFARLAATEAIAR